MLGKNIIITDNIDWGTREIVDASMGRWQVENRFRVSNNSATRWTPVGSYSPCLYKGPPRGKYAAFFAGIFSKSSTRNKQLYFFDKVIACLRISMPMVQRDLLTWFSKNLSL